MGILIFQVWDGRNMRGFGIFSPAYKIWKIWEFWALEIFIKSNKTFLTFEAEYVQRKCKQAHYMLGSEGEMVQNHLHFLFFYFPQLMLN